MVLQQSLRDAESAYRNFFASFKGTRKGPELGPPRFKSRRDARQSIRFTANARWMSGMRAREPGEVFGPRMTLFADMLSVGPAAASPHDPAENRTGRAS